jgi:hypothetical protein
VVSDTDKIKVGPKFVGKKAGSGIAVKTVAGIACLIDRPSSPIVAVGRMQMQGDTPKPGRP